jgi:predicted ArsR family transcriptional regulator
MASSKKKDTRNKVSSDKLFDLIGKKNGRTVQDLSDSTGVTPATIRKYTKELVSSGRIIEKGYRSTGERGRPATIYVQAQTGSTQTV